MKKIYLLALLIFVLSIKMGVSEEIRFFEGSYSELIKFAKAENKIIMIDFFTDWCKWCVELDRNVYTNKEVGYFANTNQVNWKIDAEKGEGPELAKKYNVDGYPTIVFLNPDEQEVDRIVGYLPAEQFLKTIKEFNEGINTMQSLQKIYKQNPDDGEVNFRIGEKYFNYGDAEKSKTYFEKVISNDPDNISGFKDDAEFYIAALSGNISDMRSFVNKYPESEKIKDAYMSIAQFEFFQNNYDESKKYFDLIITKYGKTDPDFRMNYGNFLVTIMYTVYKDSNWTKESLAKGFLAGIEAMEYVAGTINEASVYFYISEFCYRLGNYRTALTSIEKSISIFDKKDFKKQRDKILSKM